MALNESLSRWLRFIFIKYKTSTDLRFPAGNVATEPYQRRVVYGLHEGNVSYVLCTRGLLFLSFPHPLLEFAGTENGLEGQRFPILSFAFQGFWVFDKKSRKKVRPVCHGFTAMQASVPWSRTRHLPPQDLVPEFPSDIHSRISFLRLSVCHHVLMMPLACCFGRQGSSESSSCANTESSPEEQALWVSWPLGEYCSKATDRSMYSCEEENNGMNISTERTLQVPHPKDTFFFYFLGQELKFHLQWVKPSALHTLRAALLSRIQLWFNVSLVGLKVGFQVAVQRHYGGPSMVLTELRQLFH